MSKDERQKSKGFLMSKNERHKTKVSFTLQLLSFVSEAILLSYDLCLLFGEALANPLVFLNQINQILSVSVLFHWLG